MRALRRAIVIRNTEAEKTLLWKKENPIPTGSLEISLVPDEKGALVCLSGGVSIDTSPKLRDRLLALLEREAPVAVTVDLSEVPYLDSSGIATLIEALKVDAEPEIYSVLERNSTSLSPSL
jgi:anti-anti-sigma factor